MKWEYLWLKKLNYQLKCYTNQDFFKREKRKIKLIGSFFCQGFFGSRPGRPNGPYKSSFFGPIFFGPLFSESNLIKTRVDWGWSILPIAFNNTHYHQIESTNQQEKSRKATKSTTFIKINIEGPIKPLINIISLSTKKVSNIISPI